MKKLLICVLAMAFLLSGCSSNKKEEYDLSSSMVDMQKEMGSSGYIVDVDAGVLNKFFDSIDNAGIRLAGMVTEAEEKENIFYEGITTWCYLSCKNWTYSENIQASDREYGIVYIRSRNNQRFI